MMKRKENRRSRKRKRTTAPPHRGSDPNFKATMDLFQRGSVAEAFESCRRLTATHPYSARAWHLLGRLAYQLDKTDAAIDYMRKAVSLNPDYAAALNDLGNALTEKSHLKEAENSYRQAIRADSGYGVAYTNLGRLFRQQGKFAQAIEAGKEAVRLAPDANAHYNLALSQKEAGKFPEAIDAFRNVLALDHRRPDVLRQLCGALRHAQRWDEAQQACALWLTLEPDNPVANHIQAALGGPCPPERAGDHYVREVFDTFAGTYDREMQALDYQGPKLLMGALKQHFLMAAADLDTLDAGCGTGICGPILRPFAKRLTGVDLSEKMLQQAHRHNCYDELANEELTAFLGAHPDRYDLIVAIDTLNYFGDLTTLIHRIKEALRPRGVLMFTLERSAPPQDIHFQLHPSGRYSHSDHYIIDLLGKAYLLRAAMETVTLRAEAGQPVEGLLVRAVKNPNVAP